MATTSRPRTTKDTLTNASVRVGKALARSAVAVEKSGRKARQMAEKLVGSPVAPKPKATPPARAKNTAESPLKPNSAMTVEALIGFLAGDIYNYLAENREVPTTELFRAMKHRNNSQAYVCAALGWLAREYKIRFLDDGEKIALVE
ncbi:MAG TPA: winged helix-turn-helix domain-containing protein [Desulfurivibrionaceae bacterium]|nr:winged helix-turn-helix domain-containing protein [Desulfurivibrionaceae bacterium]